MTGPCLHPYETWVSHRRGTDTVRTRRCRNGTSSTDPACAPSEPPLSCWQVLPAGVSDMRLLRWLGSPLTGGFITPLEVDILSPTDARQGSNRAIGTRGGGVPANRVRVALLCALSLLVAAGCGGSLPSRSRPEGTASAGSAGAVPAGLGPAIDLEEVPGFGPGSGAEIAGVPMSLGEHGFAVTVSDGTAASVVAFDSVSGDRLWQFVPTEVQGADSVYLDCLDDDSLGDELLCLEGYYRGEDFAVSQLATISTKDGAIVAEIEIDQANILDAVVDGKALLRSRLSNLLATAFLVDPVTGQTE